MTNPATAAATAQTPFIPEPTPSAAPVDVDVEEVAVLLPVAVPEEGEVLEWLTMLEGLTTLCDNVVATPPVLLDVDVAGKIDPVKEVESVRDGF